MVYISLIINLKINNSNGRNQLKKAGKCKYSWALFKSWYPKQVIPSLIQTIGASTLTFATNQHLFRVYY